MNSQSYYSTGPRYFYKRHYNWGEGSCGNGFDGPSRTYLSEAQMDKIFEMVKARERERLAAEARKAAQAEAEPETYREQVVARKRERVAAEARKTAQAKAEPETYREQVKSVKRPWGGDDYASIELEARKARAERRKDGFRARVMRDEEELAAESDKMEGDDSLKRSPGTFSVGDTSATVYRSTVYNSAKSSLRNSSDCDGGVMPAATLSRPHYSSTQSGGSYLAGSVVGYQSENANGPDTIDGPPTVSYHDAASPGPSSSPVSPEHHRDDTHHIANTENQWPLRPFIPYIKTKLNDPSGRYTPEDMHQELDGLITEAMCKWMETTRRTFTNSSRATGTTDGSACSHVGIWHKKLGEAECQNCHLWKPLLVLTCPGCGLKKCVRCKFENADTEKVVA